jgi:hypothetical protein
MKTVFGALALLIAVPAAAQTAPAAAPKADCCEKMKAEGKECCCKDKDHSKMDHSKHDMNDKSGAADSSSEQNQAH